jgi:hypothetical protein
MTKPRTIAGLIGRVLKEDPSCDSIRLHSVNGQKRLLVLLKSVEAKMELADDVELDLVNCERITVPTGRGSEVRYMLDWDVSRVGFDKSSGKKPFQFGDRSEARRIKKAVRAQEESAASLIGGRRHVGSGAIPGIKSDASSETWQVEAKRTERKSFGLSVDLLSKITAEAATTGRDPMMYITFGAIPKDVRVEDTWVVIPRSKFEEIND